MLAVSRAGPPVFTRWRILGYFAVRTAPKYGLEAKYIYSIAWLYFTTKGPRRQPFAMVLSDLATPEIHGASGLAMLHGELCVILNVPF